MKLKPLGAHQLYVSGLSSDMVRHYKEAPGLINQHSIQAIFEPVNDTPMVLLFWSFGGFNIAPRTTVNILDTEKQELLPAWE